jgi:preprotein translocase subunit SecG
MTTVLLVIHIMVAAALVGVVLLQRSEGGALGIGGGGGFMTGRGAGNALTKATGALAACFFATSLALSLLASHTSTPASVLIPGGPSDGVLPNLQLPAAPAPQAPAAPVGPQAPQSQ